MGKFEYPAVRPSKNRKQLSLRKLIARVLSALLAITLLLAALGVTIFVYRSDERAWRTRQGDAVVNAAARVNNFIELAETGMQAVGDINSDYLVEKPEILKRLVQDINALQEVVRLDKNGRMMASWAVDQPVLASMINIHRLDWFQAAVRGDHFHGPVQISGFNLPYMIVAQPAETGGVVAGRLKMDMLWQVVGDIRFGKTGRAYLVDSSGRVIAYTDRQIMLENASIANRHEFLLASQALQKSWFGQYWNFAGERVVGATTEMAHTGWIVFAEISRAEAFEATRNAFLIIGGGMIFLALAAIFVGRSALDNWVLAPIGELAKGAQKIGAGDLSYRIPVTRQDEIGMVAESFNEMALRLEERERLLTDQAKVLSEEIAVRTHAETELHAKLVELKEVEARLRQRIELERLVATLSTNFITQPVAQIDQGINQALGLIGEFCAVDRSYVILLSEDHLVSRYSHQWVAERVEGQQKIFPAIETGSFSQLLLLFNGKDILRIDNIDNLPAEAGEQRSHLQQRGVRSLLMAPLVSEQRLLGLAGLELLREERQWTEETVSLLKMVSSVIANAQRRVESENAMLRLNAELEDRVRERTKALRLSERDLKRRYRQQQAIFRLVELVSQAEQLEPIYEGALNCLIEILYLDRAAIMLWDEDNVMRLRAWKGISLENCQAWEGYTPWKLEAPNPQAIYIQNVERNLEIPPELRQIILAEGIHALAFVPLLSQERVLGKFMLYNDRPRQFSEEEQHLAQTVAFHVAFAVERLQAAEELRRFSERLLNQYEIVNSILSAESMESIARATLTRLRQMVPYHTGMIILTDETCTDASVFASMLGEQFVLHEQNSFPLNKLKNSQAMLESLRGGGLWVSENIEALGHSQPVNQLLQALKVHQGVSAPLLFQGRLIGVLSLGSEEANSIKQEHLQIMLEVANSLAVAIHDARLRQELASHTRDLENSLSEKEILLREIHHRVKNNLQVVSSLLSLQSMQMHDLPGRELLRESQNRVRSMAMIHEKLYQSVDLAHVNFGEYVYNLAAFLFSSYQVEPGRIQLVMDIAEPVRLDLDEAIPCGLLLNELVSNAIKHAFPERRSGQVGISLKEEPGGWIHFTVRDDGIGFPVGFDWRNSDSLGLQLVTTLVEQLNGVIEVDPAQGLCFDIKFRRRKEAANNAA
jgi:two-component sensor histidine kinase/HAMP domain-containing protein